MFRWLMRRRREAIRRRPLPAEWRAIMDKNVPYVACLPSEDRDELAGHIQIFLAEKQFEGCGGLQITDEIRVTIAAQACILLLHRRTDYFSKLVSILVYPSTYVAPGGRSQPGGLMTDELQARIGESWVAGVDTTRVVNAYAANRPLMEALGAVAKRKDALIGRPISGFGVYRPDMSRGPAWSVAGARFMLVTVTRSRRPAPGAVWEMADSTLYILRPVRTRQQAEALAGERGARIFAVRPNWSMPAAEWVVADPDFWRLAPAPGPRR